MTWIRCEEQLAPKDRYVLVFSRSYGVIVAARVASRMPYWFVSAPDGATVADTTHWQPLPKPPRKRGKR